MAARRLIIVMLVLLGLSTLAAALVPPQEPGDETESTASTSTGTTTEPEAAVPARRPSGEALDVAITVDGKQIPVVPIHLGDQLSLTLCSKRTDLLAIPDLKRFAAVAPGSPAFLNILPTRAGSYGINFVASGELAARIQVDPPTKRAREESDRAQKGSRCESAGP